MNDSKQLVLEVIQRVYGDATQTELDDHAASEIIAALRRVGWASPDDVALLIKAAGGEITITRRMREESTKHQVLESWEDLATDSTVVRARDVEWTAR